jgi:hypothetical protein
MAKSWLAGVALFAFGFGCAQVMHVATADAQDTEMEEGFQYVDHGDKYELINTSGNAYMVRVKRKPGFAGFEPQVKLEAASAMISKDGLEDLSIFRITTVGKLVASVHPPFRICDPPQNFVDCPLPRPDPPPPEPMVLIEPDPRYGH